MVKSFLNVVDKIDIKSIFYYPIFDKDTLTGIVGFSTSKETFEKKTGDLLANYSFNLLKSVVTADFERSNFERALSNNMKGYLILDNSGRIIKFNKKVQEILDYPSDEILNSHFIKFIDPDKKNIVLKDIEKIDFNTFFQDRYETAIITKNKIKKFVNIYISINPISDYEVIELVDITESKKVERKYKNLKKFDETINEIYSLLVPRNDLDYQLLLKTINKFTKLDKIGFGEISDSSDSLYKEYLLENQPTLSEAFNSVSLDEKKRLGEMLVKEQIVFINNGQNNFEIEAIDQIIKEYEIQSLIISPIYHSDEVIGVLIFDLFDKTYQWENYEIEFLLKVGRIISDYLEKKIGEQKLKTAFDEIINTLSKTLGYKDIYTFTHQMNVAQIASLIARRMKIDEKTIENIIIASKLHDIGKINVPFEILNKSGKLTKNEYEIIKEHPQIGYDLTKNIEFPGKISTIIFQHHENVDGSGYPKGLSSKDLLIESKIVCVADSIDAMLSHRPYRGPLSIDTLISELRKYKGIKYDAGIVELSIQLMYSGEIQKILGIS